uniref:Putative secreted peptide n=1 Tax=Anopheles braziliensis TaxID=58242 RepID=A0A2M3ZTL1_9DIPT
MERSPLGTHLLIDVCLLQLTSSIFIISSTTVWYGGSNNFTSGRKYEGQQVYRDICISAPTVMVTTKLSMIGLIIICFLFLCSRQTVPLQVEVHFCKKDNAADNVSVE